MSAGKLAKISAEILEQDDVMVIVLSGTFNRRIALPEFDDAVRELRRGLARKKVVVDLVDIVAMDSKGEGELENLLADVISGDGRASVVVDPSRRYLYVGLEELVRALGNAAEVAFTRDDAISFVREAA